MFGGSSKTLMLGLVFLLVVSTAPAQQGSVGSLRGRVVDQLGALVGGASVTVIAADGKEQKAQSSREGTFTIEKLTPGTYTLKVTATGFAPYDSPDIVVVNGRTTSIDVSLAVTVSERVTVANEPAVNTDPDANASATVLKGSDIDALPSNSQELAAALQALAGPSAGPNGGEIFIDGFSGGKLPPRDTIREIRINQNPFSSEFDRLGLGRIEIFTKPGTETFQGETAFEFEDESLNSRNPFARNRPPFQVRNWDGSLSGPLIKNAASFFVDVERVASDNNSLINAIILGPTLNALPLQFAVLTPTKDVEVDTRFDFKLNDNNTVVARYAYSRSKTLNAGLGGFDLPSRAYNAQSSDHTVRITETSVINPTVVNESRFQYIRRRNSQGNDDQTPTIRVLDSFNSGGPNTGLAFSNDDRFELQNFTSFLRGLHTLKVGLRLRQVRLADSSPGNFAGTFTFTSLVQYRNTILDLPGALPTQFSIAGGQPEARVSQTDLGLFVQDDWRVRPDLTLSMGLRYEAQTNVSQQFNFAPRFGFAYAPGTGGKNKPVVVFRGGVGIFYDRFGESFTLQSNRYNGVNQQQFIVTDPVILSSVVFTQTGVSNVPTVAQLEAFAQPQTTRVVATDLRVPYTIQSAIGFETQLPGKTTLSVSYVNAQTRRLLRSRNVNAPINGVRPNPATGNIYQYEATGRFNQNQLILVLRSNISETVSLFSNYAFGGAQSDSDGAGTFPANSYDLSNEYGRAALDVRHRFVVGGNLTVPQQIILSPFITFRSGVPFNITTGTDLNADALFTDRPAFATDLSEFGIVNSRFGAFDPTPDPGDQIIPRNYGRGPKFFIINLRASREFGFGGGGKKEVEQNQGGGGGRGGINNPLGVGAPRPAPAQNDDDDEEESRYKLELSLQVRNLFNHTNPAAPVGNLRSSLFGQSTSLAGGFGFGGGGSSAAGNRRLIFEVQFSF